jgi:Autographiviridae RNA polymerase
MTYAFSVTIPGATRQVADEYGELRQNSYPDKGGFRYLAEKTLEACDQLLSGPAEVKEYVRALAALCTAQKRLVNSVSPTGFPWSNNYKVPKVETVSLYRNGGFRIRHRVANGATDQINESKALDAAAPNLVHSLDASHLIRTVNSAVRDDIANSLTVHDSFACLAPQAVRFNQIIRLALSLMYTCYDPLARLRDQTASDSPLPPHGNLDPLEVQNAEYCWA